MKVVDGGRGAATRAAARGRTVANGIGFGLLVAVVVMSVGLSACAGGDSVGSCYSTLGAGGTVCDQGLTREECLDAYAGRNPRWHEVEGCPSPEPA